MDRKIPQNMHYLRNFILALLLAYSGSGWAYFDADLSVPTISSTGNYTVNWTVHAEADLDEMEHLQQSFNGGAYTNVYTGFAGTKSFTGKPEGTYSYRVRWDICFFGCTYLYTLPETIVVDSSFAPDSYSDQLSYEYEIRTGDFDGNGYVDVLVDRLTPGIIDGSMQTTIIEGSSTGTTIVVPTQSELNAARAHPIDPNIKPGGSDENFDGYADILLTGLSELVSPSYPYDCLILYASGVEGVAQPLGHVFMDEGYMELFDNIASAAEDPGFYAANQLVTIDPEFGVVFDCQFQFTAFASSLWQCRPRVSIVGFDVQVLGIGFHPTAPSVTDALDEISTDDFSNGNPWWRLSQLMKGELGVHSFGFQNDGSRIPSNYDSQDADDADEFDEMWNSYWIKVLASVALRTPPPTQLPEEWPRHVYDVNTSICSTTSDTVFVEVMGDSGIPQTRIIPAGLCTLDNVYCWAKRRPAPRVNQSTGTVVPNVPSVLTGNNPIRTFLFPNERVLINETIGPGILAGPGRDGHLLHDPLQDPFCAEFADFNVINSTHPRCSYVHRQILMNGSDVNILTHGEGHNPEPMDAFNAFVGGNIIFPGVDKWIRRRLAVDGACTDGP